MSASIATTDINATIQRALSAGNVLGRPAPYNRRCRRAMRKRWKVVRAPLAVTPRLGAAPRGPATRQGSGTSRTRRPESEPTRAGMPPHPTFTPLPSELTFGPPTDISMGWDGTLWAIDAAGAPHLYDPTQNAWLAHGDGIDAAASYNDTSYFFRGNQVLQINATSGAATLTTIAQVFPNVPDSFKLGVSGAAFWDTALILFRGGRWVLATGTIAPFAPQKLSDMDGWPTTPGWQDGLITGVYSDGANTVWLFNSAEYVTVIGWNFPGGPGVIDSGKISSLFNWGAVLPAAWLSSGVDAGITTPTGFVLFNGTTVAQFDKSATNPIAPVYLPKAYPNWPATWHPVLNHAPSGRMGNLWVSANGGRVLQHDGDTWNVTPGLGPSAAVGQDGSVFVIGTDGGLFQWDGTRFNPQGDLSPLAQVSVGDGNHVWVRDGGNTVHRYQGNNAFSPVDLGAGVPNPTHMAANADGTLWHCNSANANIFRLISESTNPSDTITVKGGVVTSVQKVASTGFGAAYCLAQQSDDSTQMYGYDSPFVFKTSQPYTPAGYAPVIEQGLGLLYLTIETYPAPGQKQYFIVALDAHTGTELARSQAASANLTYGNPVFDPLNDLIYVCTHPNDYTDYNSNGQIHALDARTLTVKWTFTTKAGIDETPALNGTQLCVGDRWLTLYKFDTRAALVAAPTPTPTWTWDLEPFTDASSFRVATPVLANGQVYAAVYGYYQGPLYENGFIGGIVIAECDAGDGSGPTVTAIETHGYSCPYIPLSVLAQPALGTTLTASSHDTPALYIVGGNRVYAYPLNGEAPSRPYFQLTADLGVIWSGLVWDTGESPTAPLPPPGADTAKPALWFGDMNGVLYSLDRSLQPVNHTPHPTILGAGILTTPVIYRDAQGGVTVLYNGIGRSLQEAVLRGFDPVNGNEVIMPTGATVIGMLSKQVTNGVIYAGGYQSDNTDVIPQVFSIRVDELPQTLRDFIIESQLMQDPDSNATGGSTDPNNPIPPSVARYQTHLTVVDDQKNPQPYEAVKIWADKPNTTITVDGQPFTVGPGDTQYASVKTGLDGSLVIVSNASDMFATPLRVWAGFMDPYERIVVNPDQEFHARVTTAHAVANDDDPDKANLQTAHNYNGQALFTDGEKSQNQPKNCADAVGQMNKGVGLSGGASKATFVKGMRAITGGYSTAEAGAAPQIDKYLAYADLTGASHFPANIPALRPANVAAPVGLRFARPQDGKSSPPAFAAMHHTDALAAIDALPSTKPDAPWLKSALSAQSADGAFTVRRTDDLFTDFWNWLKGAVQQAVAYITHIIVAVAEDVVVCIRMIVNGIEQVFKAIIKVVEDIAAAIGSFFQMLEKLIEDVIAALSVLFHFGEIIHTHKWIRDQINANLQQAIGAMQNQVKPPVDQFFQQGEQAITTLFSNIRQQLGINDDTQINSLNSAGSTAHTAFTAGPGAVGPTSGGNSHAVQCTHTTQKMKNGLPSAAQPGHSVLSLSKDAPAIADDDDDALSAFVTNFVNSLQTNPAISTAFNNLKSAINNIGQSQSAGDFFKSALSLLLTLVEDLILGMVAVTQALVDGLIGAIQALINTVVSLLNTPVDIPFLSWLYQLIFGEPLTILNAVSLVAAIPVTIIYRVVEGRYPSEDGITGTAVTSAALTQPRRTAVSADVIKKMQGLIGGTIAIGLGIARAVVDLAGPAPPRIGTIFVLTFGVAYVSTYFPLMIPGAVPTATQWAEWGLGAGLALLGTFGVINLKGLQAATQALFKVVLTFLRVGLGIARFIVFIVAFATSGNRNVVTNVQFARNLFLELPPMFNWLKLLADPANVVLTGIDAVTGVVVCALDITAAFLNTEPDPRRQRPLMA